VAQLSLYVIADLHLSTNTQTDKSMEVFGRRWTDYTQKLERTWRALVTDTDTVIIPGDISWALSLEEALPDLKFIDSLPGKKYLGKGNHDYWWSTMSKMTRLFEENGIKSISFLYNNAVVCEDYIVAGSRGWFVDEGVGVIPKDTDYKKLVQREAARLRLSLQEAAKLKEEHALPILVCMHFPVVWGDFVCRELLDILKEYDIKKCCFGHIHGAYDSPSYFEYDGITFSIVSADYLNFIPRIIFPQE
jgi:predicted phosphohydrolase